MTTAIDLAISAGKRALIEPKPTNQTPYCYTVTLAVSFVPAPGLDL